MAAQQRGITGWVRFHHRGGAVLPCAGVQLAWILGMSLEHVSIGERLAFGRPLDLDRDPPVIPVVSRPTTALVGRILLAAIFLLSGFAKLADPAGAVGYMKGVGIPAPDVLVWVAALAEVFGGLAILAGFLTRVAALGLIVYLAITTLVFHAFWTYGGAEQKTQMVNFMKNLAILGGLFSYMANGAGRYSADYALRRPMAP